MSDPATLLIVDDERHILSALRRSLRREGYTMHLTESFEEALDILGRERVDAVLSDERMPGHSGRELLARAKELQPGAVRILVTGWAGDIPKDDLTRIGIAAVLPKPWDEAELKLSIRKALAGGA